MPVLWHIPISHYSEKVRWALHYKGVEHERRTPTPGLHRPLVLALTRGRCRTVPLLELDGERVCDSTAIIAALERRFPDPPLYPADADDRRRALALEDWFNERLGPPMRIVAWHELIADRPLFERTVTAKAPHAFAARPRFRRMAVRGAGTYVDMRYRVKGENAAALARDRVLEALDHLEAELDAGGAGDYLVGDRFSVADLTGASLFYPLVFPAEGPKLSAWPPQGLEQFRAPLTERPGYRWVEKIYRRHRRRSP